jgi:5-(carboxyamino)imidazole ribonucleotide synthase
VNEIAPRVHNSGHWTIDGATASQFEQHIRAVAGWPLAKPKYLAEPGAASLGRGRNGQPDRRRSERLGEISRRVFPAPAVHLYGKGEARPGAQNGPCHAGRARAESSEGVGGLIARRV